MATSGAKATMATAAAARRLLLLQHQARTARRPFSCAPAAATAAREPASARLDRRRSAGSRGAASASLLLMLLLLGADTETRARCEPLSRLEASGRRHTGTAPQKNAAEAAGDSDALQQTTATTAYFDAEYEATGLVGAGSFGMVLQCVSKRDGRVAAVKMVQDLAGTRAEVARETAALARVQQCGGHAAIVRFDGAYAHNGFHYIVTEFVAGESLHAFLEARRRVDVPTALRLVAQLADALAFLHQSGVVHRDLKPENIMVLRDAASGDGSDDDDDLRTLKLKIIDFGSAGSAGTEEQPPAIALSGTRCYCSPEVLLRQELSPAMDAWALGCVLYILICGRHPFDLMGASSEEQVVQRVVAREGVSFMHPAWAGVPGDVKALVRGLLEKDPRARLTADAVLAHASVQRACRGD